MLEQFEVRIKELTQQLEQSLVNHNFIAGALNEVRLFKELYQKVHNILPVVESTVPEVEEAVKAIEDVIDAVVE